MKKIMLILAVCVALTACKKEELTKGISFKEGQTVTLSVGAGVDSNTKISSVSGVDLTWDEGDQILVTVGDKSSIFTLKTGAGTGQATFEGTMPASGTHFDIQYPVEDPDLSEQNDNQGQIASGLVKYAATNCTTTNCTLEMQSAIVKIPFTSTDEGREVYVLLDAYSASFQLYGTEVDYYFVVDPFDETQTVTLTVSGDDLVQLDLSAEMSCPAGTCHNAGTVFLNWIGTK